MSSILLKIKPNEHVISLLFETKKEHMVKLSKTFELSIDRMKEETLDIGNESNVNMSVLNLAIDFLILEIENEKLKGNYRVNLKKQIFNASVYHANELNLEVN